MDKTLTHYWSRIPGKFVDRHTGISPDISGLNFPTFAGSIREWYETLIETCHSLHIETNREANAIIVSSDVLTFLMLTCIYVPCFDSDGDSQNFMLAKVGNFPSMGLSVYQDGSDDFIRLVYINKKNMNIEEIAQLNILDTNII